jgi:protein LTV1
LESSLSPSDLVLADGRSNIGEASLYGVYFDDTEYDYLQHLRPAGGREDGFESVLVEAPTRRNPSKKTSNFPVSLHDLPPEVFASASELPRDFESQAAVQSSISGLQPDMDPHLRQTLEALEDDAYVDDDLDDDFFGELVKDGERDATEGFEFEFREDGLPTDGSDVVGMHKGDGGDEAGWQARFAAFKREQQGRKPIDTPQSDCESEEADAVGQMPKFSTSGNRRRRQETSDASGFSMSSASVFRSDGLRDLDDRFDQVSVLEPLANLCADRTCRLRRSISKVKGAKTSPRIQMILTRHRCSSRREKILTLSWTTSYTITRCLVAR